MARESVTLRDVYEAISSLENKINNRIDKVEAKVDVIEGFKDRVIGIGIVISVFVSGLATFIWNKIVGE